MNMQISNSIEVTPNKLVIIEGDMNFIIINLIKHTCFIICFISFALILWKIIKHKKLNKILIITFIISLIITFLAVFTGVYDNFMRIILPYRYGV